MGSDPVASVLIYVVRLYGSCLPRFAKLGPDVRVNSKDIRPFGGHKEILH